MRKRQAPTFNLFEPTHVFMAILIVALFFFAPVVYPTKEEPDREKKPLQEFFPALNPFASTADACPFRCVVCTSWDPDAWPRGCATYECDAGCENGDPSGGGGGPVYQPPTISGNLNCSNPGMNGWCIGTLSLDLSSSDPQGQSVIISGDVNGAAFTCPNGDVTCSVSLPEGTGTVNYKVDSATGLSATGTTTYQLDITTPQISGNINGSTGLNGWYASQTLVTASANDALSAILSFEMNVDNTGWVSYSDTTYTDGVHNLQLRAYDNAGNSSEVAQPVMVDTVPPTLSATGQLMLAQNLNYQLDDSTSGLSQLTVSIADKDLLQPNSVSNISMTGNTYTGTYFWDGMFSTAHANVGWYPFTLTVTDMAGNQSSMTGAYQVKWRNLVALGLEPDKHTDTDGNTNSTNSNSYYYVPGSVAPAGTEAPIEIIPTTEVPSEEEAPSEAPPPVTVSQNTFQGASVQVSFGAGNQTTPSQSTTTSNVLWGGAAAALLGATLAEWQRRRAEEEAGRRAAMKGDEDNEEESNGGGGNKAGRAAYAALMQQKHIVGKLQADLNENAKQKQADLVAKAMVADVTEEERFKLHQAEQREDALLAQRAGERNAEQIVEDYQARQREQTTQAYHAGERDAVQIAEEYKTRQRELVTQAYRAEERDSIQITHENKPNESNPRDTSNWLSYIPFVGPFLNDAWQNSRAKKMWDENSDKNIIFPWATPKNVVTAFFTLALGYHGILWADNIVSNPHIFDEAERNYQAEFQQLRDIHPPTEENTKFSYLISNPYEAVNIWYGATEAYSNSVAGFIDAIWQQNPAVQYNAAVLEFMGDDICSSEALGEAWGRRCSAVPYFIAGLAKHPADTITGVSTSLVADPVAGFIKLASYGYEYNNPYQLVSDTYQSVHKDGLISGVVNVIKDRIDGMWNLVTTDPQVQSFSILLALGALALVPVVGAPLALLIGGGMVLSQTASLLTQVDAALQAAPTREEAMKYVSSQNVRRTITVTLILLALVAIGGFKGIQEFYKFQTFPEALSPSAQSQYSGLSLTEQIKLFNIVEKGNISPSVTEFYLDQINRPNSVLSELSITDGLNVLEGKVIQVEPNYAPGLARQLSEITGKNVWYSADNGRIYVSNSTSRGMATAQSLVLEGPNGPNVGKQVVTIAQEGTRGSGNRVVLGMFEKNGGHIGIAIEEGGIFLDTGSEVWALVQKSGIDPWIVNEQFLRSQLEAKISRIDFVGEDIFDVINSSDVKVRNSFRANEIRWLLENAEQYGYVRIGNSWVLP